VTISTLTDGAAAAEATAIEAEALGGDPVTMTVFHDVVKDVMTEGCIAADETAGMEAAGEAEPAAGAAAEPAAGTAALEPPAAAPLGPDTVPAAPMVKKSDQAVKHGVSLIQRSLYWPGGVTEPSGVQVRVPGAV
jgi:hypothetical protein